MSHAPERAYRSACNAESIPHKCLGDLFLHVFYTYLRSPITRSHKKLNIVAIENGESMLYNYIFFWSLAPSPRVLP
jgi:hypothetical protein